MRRCPIVGISRSLAKSLMEEPGTQDSTLHFLRLSGSMNHVEECMGQDPGILRWRILAGLGIKGTRRSSLLVSLMLLEGGPSACVVLISRDNLVDSWRRSRILGYELGGWMHFRSRTQRDCMDLLVYLVDLKSPLSGRLSLIARLFVDFSQEIAGLSYGPGDPIDPEVSLGPGDVVGTRRCSWDPEAVSEARRLPQIRRSYLGPEGHFEPGGCFWTRTSFENLEVPLDPEVVLNPEVASVSGGRLGTWRSYFGPEVVLNPEVASGPGGRLGTRRFLQTLRSYFGPGGRFEPGEVIWEPGGSFRPSGRILDPEVVLNPEVTSGPGGRLGTRRFLQTPRSYFGPGGRFVTRRFAWNSEVRLRTRKFFWNSEVCLFVITLGFSRSSPEFT
ncbi:hypothetical protein Bca4012_020134 [Brassica carinata]